MTSFEDKQTIVIKQLRADRDRLLTAIEDIKAEIISLWGNDSCANECGCLDEILEIIDKHTSGKENDD